MRVAVRLDDIAPAMNRENFDRMMGILSSRRAMPLLGVIPEDPAVYRSVLKHELFVRYNCEASHALFRIASRIKGKPVPIPAFRSIRKHSFRRFFSRTAREVSPIDDF